MVRKLKTLGKSFREIRDFHRKANMSYHHNMIAFQVIVWMERKSTQLSLSARYEKCCVYFYQKGTTYCKKTGGC